MQDNNTFSNFIDTSKPNQSKHQLLTLVSNKIKQIFKEKNSPNFQLKHIDFQYFYKTYEITVRFIDSDRHSHLFRIVAHDYPDEPSFDCTNIDIEYRFKGHFNEIDLPHDCDYLFSDFILNELWKENIIAYIFPSYNNTITIRSTYANLVSNFLYLTNLIETNLKPISWFYEREHLWLYRKEASHLTISLPHLRHEAFMGRWKDVGPNNISLRASHNYSFISLTYSEPNLYNQHFVIGYNSDPYGLLDENLKCSYIFENLTTDPIRHEYLEQENLKFTQFASRILELTFSHEAEILRKEKAIVIHIKNPGLVAQKYGLFLDLMLSLKDAYKADPFPCSDKFTAIKSQFESTFQTEFDSSITDNHIFTHGYFLKPQPSYTFINIDEEPIDIKDLLVDFWLS